MMSGFPNIGIITETKGVLFSVQTVFNSVKIRRLRAQPKLANTSFFISFLVEGRNGAFR